MEKFKKGKFRRFFMKNSILKIILGSCLLFPNQIYSQSSVKNLEKKSTTQVEERKSPEGKEGLEEIVQKKLSGIPFSFISSDKNNYNVYYNIDSSGINVSLENPNAPPFVIDEAKFCIAFDKWIKDVYGSRENFASRIDVIINDVDDKVENIMASLRFAQAIKELGNMAAVNIYYGGLSGKENKKFLEKIATNYVAGVIYDIAEYYGFSANDLSGRVLADIIKTATGIFLTRSVYSNENPSDKLFQSTMAGFFSQISLGKRLMQEAKEHCLGNDYNSIEKAYDNFKYGFVSAYAALEGFAYLANEEYNNRVSQAFSSIVGAYIGKELRKSRELSELEKIANIFESLNQLFATELSDGEKASLMKKAFQQGIVGEAARRTERAAKNLQKNFWFVDMYYK
jgi:hypothetical protein